MERRRFLQNMGTTAVSISFLKSSMAAQLSASAEAAGHVVVVGGGMAGTTVAKYLRLWGGAGMDVTLVEPNATYYSNIFSNMVLTGERTLSQLSFNYNIPKSKYGVKIQNYSIKTIDPVGKKVTLSNGVILPYDRLVLVPGIDFEPLPNLTGSAANQVKIVHARKAGTQTVSLQNQIKAMTSKDTFILTIPPASYRCPPGPYERACVVADYLKRTKGGGKVIILDANPKVLAFIKAFNETHKEIITYVPNAPIASINADTMKITTTSGGIFTGKIINAIPTHKAGNLITQSGIRLNNSLDSRWATVNVLSYESTNLALAGIHIIGDSSSTTQTKAGHFLPMPKQKFVPMPLFNC
jgi:NADPH-dependent 2,4-dienoyl-CoA reductase/sulfur reductase-like enzyme